MVVLVMLLTLTPSVSASVKDSLDFSANVAQMMGHLDLAMLLLKEGDKDGAMAHAGHPVEEYWTLIGGRVKEKDQRLFQALDRELGELPNLAETASAGEFEAKIREVFDLLKEAEALVVPREIREGFIFKIKVVMSLLETARSEYSVGIGDAGEVKNPEEYQDSVAFVKRAEGIYRGIRGVVEEKEAREIDGFFQELKQLMEAGQSPSKVGTMIDGILQELREVADIGEVKEKKGPAGIIEDTALLLQKVVEEYGEEEYEEAEELAIKAYLENFELVEGPLGEVDPELNEELERLIREELRQLIKDRAPVAEVNQLVEKITGKLEAAKSLLREQAPSNKEAANQVAQPLVKEKPNMVPWIGAVAVLLGIAIAEGVVIYKLRRRE